MEKHGTIVIMTGMRRIPSCCVKCLYYSPWHQGDRDVYHNNGVCLATMRSTAKIKVGTERLKRCPLMEVEGWK